MKKTGIVLLLFCCLRGSAQTFSVDYSAGYATYQLDQIRALQKSMVGSYGAMITDCFPSGIIHSGALGFMSDRNYWGLRVAYLTTGGRLHHGDYSGFYLADMILNGYRVGPFYRYSVPVGVPSLRGYFQTESGFSKSTLRIEEKLSVYTVSDQSITSLEGWGFYFEPSVGVTYRITQGLHVSLGGGYEIDMPNSLSYSGEKTDLKINWSGLRVYASLIVTVPSKKTQR